MSTQHQRPSFMAQGRIVSARAFDASFEGEVPSWIYSVLRVGLAGLFLIRSGDWLRGVLPLDHHEWVHGFDFSWSIALDPALVSPLVPGLVLGAGATWLLLRLRVLLGAALLIGIWPGWAALVLGLSSYALMFADRYSYFHHLHVLYLSIAWLALALLAPRCAEVTPFRAAWPLQLLRAAVLSIYLAAGSAKLQHAWWSGDSLAILDHVQALRGPIWVGLKQLGSFGMLAKAACLTELGLPVLLLLRPTRRLGVLLGVAFHALISGVMPVSTFGATMALLLLSFWPERRQRPPPPGLSCQAPLPT